METDIQPTENDFQKTILEGYTYISYDAAKLRRLTCAPGFCLPEVRELNIRLYENINRLVSLARFEPEFYTTIKAVYEPWTHRNPSNVSPVPSKKQWKYKVDKNDKVILKNGRPVGDWVLVKGRTANYKLTLKVFDVATKALDDTKLIKIR